MEISMRRRIYDELLEMADQPANTLPVEIATECGRRWRPASADELKRTAEKYNGIL